jgi:predicted nucleic acid-binding protein
MILADTTVVIDYLRAPTARLVKIIQSEQASICGVTIAEVYAGARSLGDFKKYDRALSLFRVVSIRKKTWADLGHNLAVLGAAAVTVPLPDALIATVAIDNNLELWNHDRHFANMQKVLTPLKLFQEPP